MSQRNPMNERYQERTGGSTRKSAASAKPATRAASSVYISSGKPAPKKSSWKQTWDKILGREQHLTSKQQKAADAAEARKQAEKQRRKEMQNFKPQSPEYKKYSTLRILFYVLGFALVLPNVIWSGYFSENWGLAGFLLILAWGCILAAIITDVRKLKPLREEEFNKTMKVKGKSKKH